MIWCDTWKILKIQPENYSAQFSSVAQSHPNLYDPRDSSTPSFPVHHQLPEFAQTHVHPVGDAIQPISSSVVPFSSCLPSFPASGSFTMSQSSHQVAKVLELQLQHQSFQWIFRTDFLWHWLVGSPCSPKNSQEFSPTSQLKSINSLVLSLLYSPTLTSIHDYWKNHSFY